MRLHFAFLDDTFLRFCIRMPEQNTALLQQLKGISRINKGVIKQINIGKIFS